eukprot:SM000168S02636  [mRNA]  locus=s168:205850:207440:- [translate_table: standard]
MAPPIPANGGGGGGGCPDANARAAALPRRWRRRRRRARARQVRPGPRPRSGDPGPRLPCVHSHADVPGKLRPYDPPASGRLPARRTGGGVPFEAYGERMVAGIAASSQAGYAQHLTQDWIPMLPDIDKILLKGGIIADVACGCGHSSVAMAKGYPKSKVHAIDADALSVGKARKLVAQEGLEGRVEVHCGLAHDIMMRLDGLRGCCDLVTLLECVHDMHNPIDVLRTARELLKEGRGAVLIADEKVEDTLEAMLPWRDTAPPSNLQLAGPDEDSTNFRARLCYGYSVLACLPQAMANSPSSATGTCMTRSTLARYARAAGWSGAEVVHQTDVWNLYRLLW